MFLQIRAALFHFDEHDGLPDKIGKGGAAGVFDHPKFQRGSGFFESSGPTERLKEVVEEDLRFTLFITGNVLGAPRGKFSKFFPARHGANDSKSLAAAASAGIETAFSAATFTPTTTGRFRFRKRPAWFTNGY
jgi:hypothetical protein